MNDHDAITMLAALAQEHRLKIFKRLIREGPSGISASTIADAAAISPTSASFHLKELERAGLVSSTRKGRFILYAVEIESMKNLLAFLTEDCCQGHPELCGASLTTTNELCIQSGGN